MTGTYRNAQPWYRCSSCRIWLKARPLWEDIQAGVKKMLLDPDRLIPGIKAQLDSGHCVADLENRLKSINQRIDMLDEAEQKALRLHLYLPNYPLDKLEAETCRITEQRQRLIEEKISVDKELSELRQAIVDEDGLRRFCQMASNNLENLDDVQWRLLLEAMHLQIFIVSGAITVRVAVPTVKNENSAIVLPTSASHSKHSE